MPTTKGYSVSRSAGGGTGVAAPMCTPTVVTLVAQPTVVGMVLMTIPMLEHA